MVRVQPTAVALHALAPQQTVLWVANLLDAAGIEASLHVSRLDLHSDWQGIELRANERSNFVTYSERNLLADRFEQVAAMLREMDTDAIWNEATDGELRILISEMIDAVIVHPDRLQVAINGAPPLTVALHEVGLRETQQPPVGAAGMGFVVSEGGLEPPRT